MLVNPSISAHTPANKHAPDACGVCCGYPGSHKSLSLSTWCAHEMVGMQLRGAARCTGPVCDH